jgi:cytochrome oxidase assembly protein ShyY1
MVALNGRIATSPVVRMVASTASRTLSSSASSLQQQPQQHPSLPPIGVAGTIFFGSLCIGTCALGVWQTQRYFEKQAMISQRTIDLQLEPITYPEYSSAVQLLPQNQQPPQSFRRIRLLGRYRHEYEFLVGPRSPPPGICDSGGGVASAPQGYYVVTPLELNPDPAQQQQQQQRDHHEFVLVNRGWVPRTMVQQPNQRRRRRQQIQQQQNERVHHKSDPTSETLTETWERPEGSVQVTVVPTQPEGTLLEHEHW